MDDRREKPIIGRDTEVAGPPNLEAKPIGPETECVEDHDFDIVFEFEIDPHVPN